MVQLPAVWNCRLSSYINNHENNLNMRDIVKEFIENYPYKKVIKGKVIPLQAQCGPEGG